MRYDQLHYVEELELRNGRGQPSSRAFLTNLIKSPDGPVSRVYRAWYRLHSQAYVPPLSCGGYGRILVFAPHPDDETIGAMGAILRHRVARDEVTVAFCSPPDPMSVRAEEARTAATRLGTSHCFLGWEERRFTSSAKTLQQVYNLLSDERPALIYLPSPVDPNPDHVILNVVVTQAVIGFRSACPLRVRLYGVLAPIPAEFATGAVDLTPFWEQKERLLYEVHRSQVTALDFRNVLIVQRMLGVHVGGLAAELYLESSIEMWLRMVQRAVRLGGASLLADGRCYFSWKHPLRKFKNVLGVYRRVMEASEDEDLLGHS